MPPFARLRPSANASSPDSLGDEATLVARAHVDVHAFGELYGRYADAVFGYCLLRLASREAAEDATSLIFTKALAGLSRYRGPSFRAWLFGIAHNVVVDSYRAARRDLSLESAAEIGDPAASPEEIALSGEMNRTLTAALSQLTPDQRQVIELRLAGLTSVEIAAAVGRSPGAVIVAQHRAMRRLQQVLTAEPASSRSKVPHA